MDLIDILLIVAGVGWLLVRRMIGDIVQVRSLLVLPLVLSVIGVFQLDDVGRPDLTTLGLIAVGVACSVVIGVARGASVYLAQRGDELWMRYRGRTVALWVLNFAVKAALFPVESAISPGSTSAASHTLLLSVGLGVLAESAVVLLRAAHREGAVVWEKGEDGRAHRPSPAFERARQSVRAGEAPGLRHVVSTVKHDW